ncbi:putative reverse transcriptase domain-containing protein [Tanacetum coccineum]
MSTTIHSNIKARILEAYSKASKGVNTLAETLKGLDKHLERKEDGGLYLAERIWVPVYGNLRTLIMNEAHAMRFWQSLQKELATRLDLSTAYHPETDDQSERTIQTLEDMLRACTIDFGGNWDTHLPAYGNHGREVKNLKKSQIPIVKVRWNPRRGPEFTWEREDEMKRKGISIQCPEASASPLRSIPADGLILKQPLMSLPAEDTSSDGLLFDGNLQLTHLASYKSEAISPLMNILQSRVTHRGVDSLKFISD